MKFIDFDFPFFQSQTSSTNSVFRARKRWRVEDGAENYARPDTAKTQWSQQDSHSKIKQQRTYRCLSLSLFWLLSFLLRHDHCEVNLVIANTNIALLTYLNKVISIVIAAIVHCYYSSLSNNNICSRTRRSSRIIFEYPFNILAEK
jgi:hypothetical protein